MSSSDLSEDEYDYKKYATTNWFNRGLTTFKRRSRLILAAVRNDVQTLRTLLDSPKWYKVRDKDGHNLLHIAILNACNSVFDYLMSLDDFPLEAVDSRRYTALMLAFCGKGYAKSNDYYACELAKRVVDVNMEIKGSSLLHWAVEGGFLATMRLLIERGIDLNALDSNRRAPLHLCVYSCSRHKEEMLAMLLCCGADPSVRNKAGYTPLEIVLKCYDHFHEKDETGNGNLVYFSIDQLSEFEFPVIVLFHIAHLKSPLFQQIIDVITDVTIDNECDNWFCVIYLLIMDTEHLKLLLEKFPSVIEEILKNYSWVESTSYYGKFYKNLNLQNVEILSQTFPSELSEFVSNINCSDLLSCLIHDSKRHESDIVETVLCLLSYGMPLADFELLYKVTGYSEAFKIFLHIDNETPSTAYEDIMTRLICDVNFNVQQIDKDLRYDDWEILFSYFAHPKLQLAYLKKYGYEFYNEKLPRVPLLQELGRDAFRQHFVKSFQITTIKKFFNLVKLLPICPTHEKIITFETKLYCITEK